MILFPCRIAPSPIHGLGLFATQVIWEGAVVWEYHDPPDFRIPLLSDGTCPCEWKTHRKYGYVEAGKDYIEFPGDASLFINHSSHPNILTMPGGQMVAAKHIYVGDEILADYREFESDPSELIGLYG